MQKNIQICIVKNCTFKISFMKNISLISKIRWNVSKAILVLLFLVAFNYSGNAQHCNFSNSNFDISTLGNHAYLSNINSNWHSYQFIFDSSGRWQYDNDISFNAPGLKEICMHIVDTSDLNVPCDTFICKTVNIQIDTCPAIIYDFSFSTNQNADSFGAAFYLTMDGYTSYQIDYGDGTFGTSNHHIYPDNSPRTVCLKVNNSNFSGCEKTQCINLNFQNNTCDSVTCVLPGDADHDMTVNNFDVFAIGLSYGRLGLRRPNSTSAYTLQPSPDWQTTHYYGYNDKFADCNGDSIINAQDAVVIYNNYIERAENVFNHRDAQLDSLPQVTLSFDTLPIIIANGTCAGAQIVGDINVSSVTTIDSSYGLAFSVEYPESFYDSCFSVAVDLDNNSWFVSNEPVILFYKNIPQFHRVDVSMVRTNGLNRSGNGRIGRIKFITEGDIFGRQLRNSSSYVYTFNVNMAQAIDNHGNKKNIAGSSTTVSFISLGYKQSEIQNLQVFPNPVNNILQLRSDERITAIQITDITGKLVYSTLPDNYQNQIDCSTLPSGIYIMQIKSDEGLSVVKLVRQ